MSSAPRCFARVKASRPPPPIVSKKSCRTASFTTAPTSRRRTNFRREMNPSPREQNENRDAAPGPTPTERRIRRGPHLSSKHGRCESSARSSGHPRGSSLPVPVASRAREAKRRSEEHTSELQSRLHLVCRLLLEKKKT